MPRIDRRTPRPAGAADTAPADPVRAAAVRGIAERHLSIAGPLLPILHAVCAEFGYIHDDDLAVLADVLNLSRAEVHGVVSFYHDFRRTPPPEHLLAVCRGEACQARGAESLYAAACEQFAASSSAEVSEVFCLGNCALGPAGVLDGRLHGRLDEESLGALTQAWRT